MSGPWDGLWAPRPGTSPEPQEPPSALREAITECPAQEWHYGGPCGRPVASTEPLRMCASHADRQRLYEEISQQILEKVVRQNLPPWHPLRLPRPWRAPDART